MAIARNPLVETCVLSVTGVLAAAVVEAANDQDLVVRINEYRASPEVCTGQRAEPTGPLAPDDRLAQRRVASVTQLQSALREAGYQPAAARVIILSGPTDTEIAMKALKQRYCGDLLSAQYAQVGVLRRGNDWQVILARPLLSSDLGTWQEAGREVLKQVNQARAESRTCGGRPFEAAPPLTWNSQLAQAALAHSRDMAERNYFSHFDKDGRHAGHRALRAGYEGRQIGENIAAGQGSAQQVVAGWLASPGHCANIMNPAFTEMGAAYALGPQSDAVSYWAQVFGGAR